MNIVETEFEALVKKNVMLCISKASELAKNLRLLIFLKLIVLVFLSFQLSQRLSIGTTPCLNCNVSTSSKSPLDITSAPPSQPKVVLNDLVPSTVKVLNTLGRANGYSEALLTLLLERQEVIKEIGFPVVLDKLEEIRRQEKKKDFRKLKFQPEQPIINVAIVVCDGDLIEQVETMLKSVVMFSLDANLHLVIVSDKETILTIGQHVIFLKLALTELGYTGFTYELHLEWFPKDGGSPDWKSMFAVCTSQRLFFPTLLKHLDAVIYLDTDLLVLSNLTEIWQIFQSEMGGGKMVGWLPIRNPLDYTYGISLPFFGKHGINAGVMLMNLTQMREFDFESRAKAIYTAYDSKIFRADQDIMNALFCVFQEKVLDIECRRNFHWGYCYTENEDCFVDNRTKNICFCDQALGSGVQILNGIGGKFMSDLQKSLFISDAYKGFRDLDIFKDSYSSIFHTLQNQFNQIDPNPCFHMTAEAMYGCAVKFLEALQV